MLADRVYESISLHFLDVFVKKGEKLGYEARIADAASSMWIDRYYLEDENARRFFNEYVYHSLGDYSSFEYEAKRHFSGGQKYLGDMTEEMFMAKYVASRYAAKGLLYHFVNGDISMNQSTFEEYYLRLCFEPFVVREEELASITRDAREMLEKTEIKIDKYFVIR